MLRASKLSLWQKMGDKMGVKSPQKPPQIPSLSPILLKKRVLLLRNISRDKKELLPCYLLGKDYNLLNFNSMECV